TSPLSTPPPPPPRASPSTPPSAPVGTPPPPPHGACTPDPRPQALELDDLAVVHEQVYLRPVVLDVPREHLGIRGLEHQLLETQLFDELGRNAGAHLRDILRDPLRLDHDHVGAGLEEPPRAGDRLRGILLALRLQLLDARRAAAGTELDADLGLGLHARALHGLDQLEPVVGGQRDEPGRDLDDVKPELA